MNEDDFQSAYTAWEWLDGAANAMKPSASYEGAW